jgi:hypothetical protein
MAAIEHSRQIHKEATDSRRLAPRQAILARRARPSRLQPTARTATHGAAAVYQVLIHD